MFFQSTSGEKFMLKTFKAHYAPSTIAHIKARALDLGVIHAAKTQLALSEADYRTMVEAACSGRTDTSADLDARERARLMRAMKAKGYVESSVISERTKKMRDNRLRDLGLIHMGQRGLGLADRDYRDLVQKASAGKSRSAALLLVSERAKVLDEMKSRGFEFEVP